MRSRCGLSLPPSPRPLNAAVAAAAAVSFCNLIRWENEALHPPTKREQLLEPFLCCEKMNSDAQDDNPGLLIGGSQWEEGGRATPTLTGASG